MKFCKDCKWASDIGSSVRHPSELWGCKNEKTGARIDPVDGEQIYRKCGVERSEIDGYCGPEAKLHEPR